MKYKDFSALLHLIVIMAIIGTWLPPMSVQAKPALVKNRGLTTRSTPSAAPQLSPWQIALAEGTLTCNVPFTQFPLANTYLPIIMKGNTNATSTTNAVASSPPPVIASDKVLPPNPQVTANDLDRTVATHIYTATRFLYTGDNPIQIEMSATIKPNRVAVLRGSVLDKKGDPLPGVMVSILDHSEYGCTFSRADGTFDLAVNGGDQLTVSYQKTNYLPAQRQVTVPLLDYAWLEDVALLPYDSKATTINTNSTRPFQVAQGSMMNDEDGPRQATLLFPQGTVASMTLPDGQIQAVSSDSFRVRATEYTVGENGDEAMPGQLPAQSGYTYAIDFSIEEAVRAGANRVDFNQPVIFYVENFLDFPVGMAVPTGYYDQEQGRWIASDNGQIIRILAINGGLAEVDTTGNNAADNGVALGMTEAERERLAGLYSAGQSLWRVGITHFTPWDCNWPWGPPADAVAPQQPTPKTSKKPDKECKIGGSVIGVHSQSLGEVVDVGGTPFQLHYQSDRALGRNAANTVDIPLSGNTLPDSLKQMVVEVSVAGQHFTETIDDPGPNQNLTFTWDGQDAYGRQLQGRQPMTIRLGYVYDAEYQQPANFQQSFGAFSGVPISGNRARREVTLWQKWDVHTGGWDASAQKMGGWSLDAHHSYDPIGQTLYLGDGSQRSAEGIAQVISTVAGNGSYGNSGDGGPATEASLRQVRGLAIGPDGSLYIADPYSNKVRRVAPDGTISTVAGTGVRGYSGDGGPATEANLYYPWGIDVAADGSLYIADRNNNRIRRVDPDGIITTVAGNGTYGFGLEQPAAEGQSDEWGGGGPKVDAADIQMQASGDGGSAIEASLRYPDDVAVASDGSFYIADYNNHRIRRVGPDGIITTIAGTGQAGFSGDGGPAVNARLNNPWRVAVGPDDFIYLSDEDNRRIRRISPDGIINTIAGNGSSSYSGDGNLATDAGVYAAGIDFGVDESLYIAGWTHQRVRRVGQDGIINTVVGSGTAGFSGDDGPAKSARLKNPADVVFGPDGSLYIGESGNYRVRKVSQAFSTGVVGDILIPSEDGSMAYVFDASGRHQRTLNTLTGATLYEFQYAAAGLLTHISDGDGNVTSIERDGSGNATVIVGPYGQRTTLRLDATGYLTSLTNAAGEGYQFGYTNDGLLLNMNDPRNNLYQFTYDPLGHLLTDADPAGGLQTLARTELADGFEMEHSTALNRNTTYRVQETTTDDRIWTNLLSDGTQSQIVIRADASRSNTLPDGTVITLQEGGDPRFGLQSPVPQSYSINTPGGLTRNTTTQRAADLSNANDPLSLTSLTEVVSVNGRSLTSVYNAVGRQFTLTSAEGRQSVATIDSQGRVLEESIPGLASVSYSYDSQGRLETITQGSGDTARTLTLSYNSAGYLAGMTDPLNRTTTFSYDAAGRVTGQVLPGNRNLSYGYDANGNLTSLTPPHRPAHTFSYTPVDLPGSYTPPDVGIGSIQIQYSYNADRQLAAITRPGNETISLSYDTAGRLSGMTLPRGSLTYGYDGGTGNLSSITAPDGGTLSYAYDGSLPTAVSWTGAVAGTISYGYDNNFWVTSRSLNGGNTIVFQYDDDGLLTQAGNLSLAYDTQNGLLQSTTLGGVTDALNYNSFGEPSQYTAAYNGAGIFGVQYSYDTLGRITTKTETISGVTTTYGYSYDTAGRLAGVTENGTTTAGYTYDANGNRLTGPGGASGSYDNQDRLLSYGGNTYTYTPDGDLLTKTSGGQTTTNYDVLGNLMGVTLPDNTKITYIVDGQNRRVGKGVNGVLQRGWLYEDTLNPVAELDGSGNIVSHFIYASRVNVPDYMVRGGITYRLISDHLGSVRLVVNASTGEVIQRLDYDEFGNVLQDTNPGFQPFGFAGGLYDPDTGLVRFGVRDYDAEVGRWTAKDPIGFDGGDANLYAYVGGDPVNLIDPSGEFLNFIVGVAIGTAFNVAQQWYEKGFDCIDWGEVGLSAVAGATGSFYGKIASELIRGRIISGVLNSRVGRAIDETATNAIDGAVSGAVSEFGGQVYKGDELDIGKIGTAAYIGSISGMLDRAAGYNSGTIGTNLGAFGANVTNNRNRNNGCACQ